MNFPSFFPCYSVNVVVIIVDAVVVNIVKLDLLLQLLCSVLLLLLCSFVDEGRVLLYFSLILFFCFVLSLLITRNVVKRSATLCTVIDLTNALS